MAVLCILVFAFMALVSCAGPDKVYRARATVAEYQAGKFIKVPSDLPTVIMQGTNTVRVAVKYIVNCHVAIYR